MQHREVTITVPIVSALDPLFVLTLNEHIAEMFRCMNQGISEKDIRVDVYESGSRPSTVILAMGELAMGEFDEP